MKVSTGLKWGFIFGLLFALVVTAIYYSAFIYPSLPKIEHYAYETILNETSNVTFAKIYSQEVPILLPTALLFLNLITLTAGGLLGGFIIAKFWDRNPYWYIKGLSGGIVALLLALLLLGAAFASIDGLLLYSGMCILMGMAISYKLNRIEATRKV